MNLLPTLNDGEAEMVRLIFRLYRYGDGVSGPLGIKKIVTQGETDIHHHRKADNLG